MAHYLANAGVLVARGETKVVFDPLFRNDYGRFRLVPQALERALFDGTPPMDGIDAVFVSHLHGDHFTAAPTLAYLRAQPAVRLYAPSQVIAALRAAAVLSPGSPSPRASARPP